MAHTAVDWDVPTVATLDTNLFCGTTDEPEFPAYVPRKINRYKTVPTPINPAIVIGRVNKRTLITAEDADEASTLLLILTTTEELPDTNPEGVDRVVNRTVIDPVDEDVTPGDG
jgi:hypothetical protein